MVDDEKTLAAAGGAAARHDGTMRGTRARQAAGPGGRVRAAAGMLVDAFGGSAELAATRARRPELTAHDVYIGVTAVLTRLLFVLTARERRLLPADRAADVVGPLREQEPGLDWLPTDLDDTLGRDLGALLAAGPGVEPLGQAYEELLSWDARDVAGGGLRLVESSHRKVTGSHYTPRALAEEVARHALEPLVHEPGPLTTSDRARWHLRPSAEILGLRVADIATGSGVFLAAAARYLGDRLVEARAAEGDAEAHAARAGRLPEAVTRARRAVISSCLYGVDINPHAVGVARLSLWLLAGDPAAPLTFLDGRLVTGDALLGAVRADQLAALDGRLPPLASPVAGLFPRRPVHWPLAFPEVFGDGGIDGGFDAVLGNPPFLDGSAISRYHGGAYREFLVENLAGGRRGAVDLVTYFALRMHELTNQRGQVGILATNTLAQGTARRIGLGHLLSTGVTIRRAVSGSPWPVRPVEIELCAVWTTRTPLGRDAAAELDGRRVDGITSSLQARSRTTGEPHRLRSNRGLAFQGSELHGDGFLVEAATVATLVAADPRNRDVLRPFLNGRDLSTRPDAGPGRWVIDFRDWPEARARAYQEVYEHVRTWVLPGRAANPRGNRRRRWWQHGERATGLYAAISGLARVILLVRHSKTPVPMMAATGPVFSDALVVVASEDFGMLGLLSSAPHLCWALSRASTLEDRPRYTPSEIFETFPLAPRTPELRGLGERLDETRRAVMAGRRLGLTKTYNLVFDETCRAADIAALRDLHRLTDEAAFRAYGWDDLVAGGLGHGFHPAGPHTRYTIDPATRRETLDRLLELNHARHASDVQNRGSTYGWT